MTTEVLIIVTTGNKDVNVLIEDQISVGEWSVTETIPLKKPGHLVMKHLTNTRRIRIEEVGEFHV